MKIVIFRNYRCEELRNCATCKFHKTGQYNKEDCERICNYTIREVDKLSADSDSMIKKCRVSDNDTCIIMFEYFYLDNEVIVQVLKNRICSEAVDVLGRKLTILFMCIFHELTK